MSDDADGKNDEDTDDGVVNTSDDDEAVGDSEQSQQDEEDEAPGSRPVDTSPQAGRDEAVELENSQEEMRDSDSKSASEDAIDSLDPQRLKRSLKFAIGRMEMMMKQTQEVR